MTNEFSNVTGYKINIQTSLHFYIPKMNYQKEKSGKKISFTIATRKIKYLGINLTKDVKDMYSENYTNWGKKLRKTQTNGSMYHIHRLEELTSLKCPTI